MIFLVSVTSAFVAHVDNVDQEKPSCEFSLQITLYALLF